MCRSSLKSFFLIVVPLTAAALSAAPVAHAQDKLAMLNVRSVSASSGISDTRKLKLYGEGLQKRAMGDELGAFEAFREAAIAGNAMAQHRLGEIYDGKTAVVERDYQEALRWYQLAREGGEQVPSPMRRSISATGFNR